MYPFYDHALDALKYAFEFYEEKSKSKSNKEVVFYDATTKEPLQIEEVKV